jgi:hypothetical protein
VGTQKNRPEPVIRRIVSDYGTLILGSKTRKKPHLNAILELRDSLFQATHHIGRYVPAVHALQPGRFREGPATLPDLQETLPSVMLDFDLPYSAEIDCTSTPSPIAFMPLPDIRSDDTDLTDAKARFLSNLQYPDAAYLQIEEMTRGQSKNISWYQQRMGSITSSMISDIHRFMKGAKINPDRIVQKSMAYKLRTIKVPPKVTVESLKWGLEYEDLARLAYRNRLDYWDDHEGVKIYVGGLMVHRQAPYIRASPDGMVSCDCHQLRLLEIKCPYAARNVKIADAIKDKKIDYLCINPDGSYYLHPTRRGYYDQIQVTMAVCDLQSCDFVVWTQEDIIAVNVPFDPRYWAELKTSADTFFYNHFVPEILTGKLRNGPTEEKVVSGPSDHV